MKKNRTKRKSDVANLDFVISTPLLQRYFEVPEISSKNINEWKKLSNCHEPFQHIYRQKYIKWPR